MNRLFDEAQQELDNIKTACPDSQMSALRVQVCLDCIQENIHTEFRYANVALAMAVILAIIAFMVGFILGRAY